MNLLKSGEGDAFVSAGSTGALLSAEPGIYLPGKFGVRIEDVIMLTDEGCIDITRSPKQLIIL